MSKKTKKPPAPKLARATPAQVKAAWEGHSKPSVRKVSEELRKIGLSCPIATLQRWRKAGFEVNTIATREKKPIDPAEVSAEVHASVKRAEGKALTRVEIIAEEELEMKAERERLLADVSITISQLSATATRESLIAQILLARQISRRAPVLAECAPEAVAKVILALKGPAASTTIVLPPNEQPGDGARVVDGRMLPEPSAAALAIDAFRSRQRNGVAA